ncbi:glycosyltransferase family 2 protein [Vicingaceae bacterium]|nr:glycosyltransferase family 2 protein [Vicingaceae bacterium]
MTRTDINACTYSIVIPCYCSGDWLHELVERIHSTMRALGESYEVILVNDASPDGTWNKIVEIAKHSPSIRGIDLMFNTGQFRTILCGLQNTKGEYVILLDDDFQTPPEEIPKLIQKMEAEPDLDCVMGEYEKKYHDLLRNMGSIVYRFTVSKLYSMPMSLKLTSFVLMKRKLAEGLCQHGTVSPVIGVLIFRTTSRIANTVVEHKPRVAGKSGYRLSRLVSIVLDNIFGASILPLRIVTLLGLSAATASIALSIYYFVKYFSGGIGAPGFMTQVILTIFFGGMTLFSIGMVGEYLIRIIDEVRKPPRYVIRQLTDHNIA